MGSQRQGRSLKRRRMKFEQLETRRLMAADFLLTEDINSGFPSAGGAPNSVTTVGAITFFSRETDTTGRELWKTDGTAAGTTLVRDILVGSSSSNPSNFVNFNGTLFFTAFDPSAGRELWKSDGTAAGTVLVKDILLGPADGVVLSTDMKVAANTLFFTADDGTTGVELWKTDGTAVGTVLVKDIRATGTSAIDQLVEFNNALYFSANDGVSGSELWRSNGTNAGTFLVRDIVVGGGSASPFRLTNVSGVLFFTASRSGLDIELFKSDGTSGGTVLVKDISPGTTSSSPRYLTNHNGTLFFRANDGVTGNELWKSNGTAASTVLVKDINTTGDSRVQNLQSIGTSLLFTADDGLNGIELFKSDGTTAGTVLVKDIFPGTGDSIPSSLVAIGNLAYFTATDSVNGLELWKSDGSSAGTQLVEDILVGVNSSFPTNLINANNTLLFSASDQFGAELWRSDGLSTNTFRISEPREADSKPLEPFAFNGSVLFAADDGLHGSELWLSDGTVTGTQLLKDIAIGVDSSQPTNFFTFGSEVYFVATDTEHGSELWRTDGTAAGTILVRDINPGPVSSAFGDFTTFNGKMYVSAFDSSNGAELWVSDGTTTGTKLFVDSMPGVFGGQPNELTVVGNTLYFVAVDPVFGAEVWKSDGTPAGTTIVKDTRPGIAGAGGSQLTNLNGVLYYFADDGSSGRELFRTNGTIAGTQLVKDILPGIGGNADDLVNFNGTLMFRANDGINGTELWKSDGTAAGTLPVKDLASGALASTPDQLTIVGSQLFFVADDGVTGKELWRSDGTSAGTFLVKDMRSGILGSEPTALTNVNGLLYFQANNGISGEELWTSDGTTAGTNLRFDFASGSGGSDVDSITPAGDRLFAVAATEFDGRELRMLDPSLTVLLPGSGSRSTLLRRNGADWEALNTAAAPTVFQSSEAAFTRSLEFSGIRTGTNATTLDYSVSGLIQLPDGVQIHGSVGATDGFQVIGAPGTNATYQSAGIELGTGSLTLQKAGVSQRIDVSELETLTVTGIQSLSIVGPLPIGGQTLSIGSGSLVNLSNSTELAGGSLQSASPIALGSGELLSGFGSVAGRLSAEVGSVISASGALTIGQATSTSGFSTRGDLNVSNNTVTLLDANEAVLGTETVLGLAALPGTLISNNGLLVDFGNNVSGFGTLSTVNDSTRPFVLNGSVLGSSLARPITLSGFIKGVGSLSNVNIIGTYSPGFSPAAVTVGSMIYAASSTTILELGGLVPGREHDQVNHIGRAQLGGTLDVQLINKFEPALGDSFTVMTASAGFDGTFADVTLPALSAGLTWQVDITADRLTLSVVVANLAPTDLGLSSTAIRENLAVGSTVGSFSTVDPNVGNTFVYSLVPGPGSTNNSLFTIDTSGNLKNGAVFNFENTSSYSVRVRTTDQGGLFFEKSFTISIIDMPEMVGGAIVGDGTAQRSLVNQVVVTFDGSITIDAGAFSIDKRGTGGGSVATTVNSTTNGQGQTVVTLSFSGAFTRSAAGALQDGYYQLTIDGTKIRRAGQQLDVNQDGTGGDSYLLGAVEADNFFALYGDTNGDGLVGIAEFGQFRSAFGKTSADAGYNPLFDFESDGSVGISDFGQFRSRFGKGKLAFV